MKKILTVLIVLLIMNNAYSFKNIEYGTLRDKSILNNDAIIIIETSMYNNIDDLDEIKKIQKNEIVKIIEIITPGNGKYGQLFNINQNKKALYKIRTKDNKTGWIVHDSFLFPFIKYKTYTIGILERTKYFNNPILMYIFDNYFNVTNVGCLNIVCLDNSKMYEKSLYEVFENRSQKYLNPTDIKIDEINNDKKFEIILSGKQNYGKVGTGAFSVSDQENWYNIANNKLIEIFSRTYSGSVEFRTWDMSYNIFDLDNDGFKETIECYELNNFYPPGAMKPIVEPQKKKIIYKWKSTSYVKESEKEMKIVYVTTVNSLRLRKGFSTDSKIIRNLNKGEKVTVLSYIDETEIINGVEGKWFEVKTESNEKGWCFGAYLKELE